MDIIIISLAALIAAALTLFSGFGLGTLLMPVAALFFPIEIAIAITALVHFANNVFKVAILGREADRSVLIAFGIPAMVFAMIGAMLLGQISATHNMIDYTVSGYQAQTTLLNLVIGSLILLFVILELIPSFSTMTFAKKYLPIGGILSGFFGGLSGHQGVFRSMFLIKAGLSKEAFVATGALLAVMVDMTRMLIYGWDISKHAVDVDWLLVIITSIAAFTGTLLGSRLLKKVTLTLVRTIVSILLIVVAVCLISGILSP